MITIYVRGIEVYGYHGVTKAENQVGHRFMVDLEMDVESDAPLTDDVQQTVDYGKVTLLAQQILQANLSKTVERLAYFIAKGILDEHARCKQVTVTLSKRLPPVAAIADEAGVVLTLDRD